MFRRNGAGVHRQGREFAIEIVSSAEVWIFNVRKYQLNAAVCRNRLLGIDFNQVIFFVPLHLGAALIFNAHLNLVGVKIAFVIVR